MNGGTKDECKDCCTQTKQRTGDWYCNETFGNNRNNPPPPPNNPPKSSKSSKAGPGPAPQPRTVDDDDFTPATDDDDSPPDDDFDQPWTYPGGDGYTCAMECNDDSDCYEGGLVVCGTCNKVHGTQGYNTCINPPESEAMVALA